MDGDQDRQANQTSVWKHSEDRRLPRDPSTPVGKLTTTCCNSSFRASMVLSDLGATALTFSYSVTVTDVYTQLKISLKTLIV